MRRWGRDDLKNWCRRGILLRNFCWDCVAPTALGFSWRDFPALTSLCHDLSAGADFRSGTRCWLLFGPRFSFLAASLCPFGGYAGRRRLR